MILPGSRLDVAHPELLAARHTPAGPALSTLRKVLGKPPGSHRRATHKVGSKRSIYLSTSPVQTIKQTPCRRPRAFRGARILASGLCDVAWGQAEQVFSGIHR